MDGTKPREELFGIVYNHIQNNLEELIKMQVCISLKSMGANHVQIITCKEILATFFWSIDYKCKNSELSVLFKGFLIKMELFRHRSKSGGSKTNGLVRNLEKIEDVSDWGEKGRC